MYTTVEKPVEKTTKKMEAPAVRNYTVDKREQVASRKTPDWVYSGVVVLFLSLSLFFSFTRGMLFFKELFLSSAIIITLMVFRSLDSKND